MGKVARNTQGAAPRRLTGRRMIDVACSLRGSKQAEITIRPQFNLHAQDFTELSKHWLTINTQLKPSSVDTARALVLLSHTDTSQLY